MQFPTSTTVLTATIIPTLTTIAGFSTIGAMAQETTFPNTIVCRAYPTDNGLTAYEAHIGKPDSTCGHALDILSDVPAIKTWLCAPYKTHDAVQIHLTADANMDANAAVVNAVHEAYPDLSRACQISNGSVGITKKEAEGKKLVRIKRGSIIKDN